ncbi:MAG: AAA family ATPase [Candidatus Aenigmarchaeota archaeon]|nr:AAA family ATPase [Candidatus Aenigmarchaeota archaeon]
MVSMKDSNIIDITKVVSLKNKPASSVASDRVNTGIPGFDDILNGGIPRGSTVLIAGTAGTGKTILSSQFLYTGVVKYKEPGVYLSLEESPESIKKNNLKFGMDMGHLESTGQFSFVKYDPYHVDDLATHLEGKIREMKAKRVVIDSISALKFYLREETNYRRMMFNIMNTLKRLGCTSFIISEIPVGSTGLSREGMAEFISDAAVVLYYSRVDSSFTRAVQVWKMRGSGHSESLHPYKITKTGVVVYPKEEAFIDVKH